jgi:hypothetical protein
MLSQTLSEALMADRCERVGARSQRFLSSRRELQYPTVNRWRECAGFSISSTSAMA